MNCSSLVDELLGLRLIGRATNAHDGHVHISFIVSLQWSIPHIMREFEEFIAYGQDAVAMHTYGPRFDGHGFAMNPRLVFEKAPILGNT